jgi:hypothetical protein
MQRLPRPDWLPSWLQELGDEASVNPVSTAVWAGGPAKPYLSSVGKFLDDLLDAVFNPSAKGTGLPQRLRLTNWDARSGHVQLHPASRPKTTPIGPAQFEATPAQLDELIAGGAIDLEQPPARAVSDIQSRIRQVLDAANPELKDDAVRRHLRK